jgi:hypothetical protein
MKKANREGLALLNWWRSLESNSSPQLFGWSVVINV